MPVYVRVFSTEQPRAKCLGLPRCLLEWLNNSENSLDVKVIDRLLGLYDAQANICRISNQPLAGLVLFVLFRFLFLLGFLLGGRDDFPLYYHVSI